jgi:hypothetical protein
MQSASIDDLKGKANIELGFLVNAMRFLEAQGLVKKIKVADEIYYENTLRGGRVTRYFEGHSHESQPNEDAVTNFIE